LFVWLNKQTNKLIIIDLIIIKSMAIFKPDNIVVNTYEDYIDIPSALAGGYFDDWEEGIAFNLIGKCTGTLITAFLSYKTTMYWKLSILKSHLVNNYMKTEYYLDFSPELFEFDNDIKLFEKNPYFKKTIGYYMLMRDICSRDLKKNINNTKILLD